VEDFSKTVSRAEKYVAAGADAVFPEALQNAGEFRDFAKAIDRPLLANMTEFGKSPLLSFSELSDLGYRMVIFPQSALRVSLKATEQFLRGLRESGTQSEWVEKMQSRKELYELLDYDPAADRWPARKS
jgi:methylisocitrate lyase